jgi:hypothetical protein
LRRAGWRRFSKQYFGANKQDEVTSAVYIRIVDTWEERMARFLITAAALGVIACNAQAATITTEPTDDGGTYIHINGDIEPGDSAKFDELVEKNKITSAVVYLDSAGGIVVDGLKIGLAIRDKGFSTFVAADTYCVSVCAVIWMAGSERYVTDTSNIGFHGPFHYTATGKPARSRGIYKVLLAYYVNELHLSRKAADYLIAAGPNDIYWLHRAKAAELGIASTNWPPAKPAA